MENFSGNSFFRNAPVGTADTSAEKITRPAYTCIEFSNGHGEKILCICEQVICIKKPKENIFKPKIYNV